MASASSHAAFPWRLGLALALMVAVQPGCLPQAERRCEVQASCDGTSRPTVCFQGMCVLKVCTPGKQQSCYEATCGIDKTPCPADIRGVGQCQDGYQVCLDNGSRWSACLLSVGPQKEACDGVDNDCDGEVDEDVEGGCDCKRGETRLCYTGAASQRRDEANIPCANGVQRCTRADDGKDRWGTCKHERTPQTLPRNAIEECQLRDIDCDGEPDNTGVDCRCPEAGKTRPCYTGAAPQPTEGPCKAGTQTCTQDKGALYWSACLGQVLPSPEELHGCDNKDNDCDGKIDNATGQNAPLSRPCGDPDQCKVHVCENKGWGSCEMKEICSNQIDDNCDGALDEQPCTARP